MISRIEMRIPGYSLTSKIGKTTKYITTSVCSTFPEGIQKLTSHVLKEFRTPVLEQQSITYGPYSVLWTDSPLLFSFSLKPPEVFKETNKLKIDSFSSLALTSQVRSRYVDMTDADSPGWGPGHRTTCDLHGSRAQLRPSVSLIFLQLRRMDSVRERALKEPPPVPLLPNAPFSVTAT